MMDYQALIDSPEFKAATDLLDVLRDHFIQQGYTREQADSMLTGFLFRAACRVGNRRIYDFHQAMSNLDLQ